MTTESVNERDLLSASMQGSQIAYRELIHLHQDTAYRFACALLGDEQAQTVTENAFITAWRQIDYLKDLHCSFRERLFQLICIDADQLEKRQRLRHLHLTTPPDADASNLPCPTMRYDPHTNMEHLALQTDIEEALQTLPLHYRKILLLHEMGGLVDTQIADLIGSSAEIVHTDFSRALGAVRRQIITNGGFFPADHPSAEKHQACKAYLPTLFAAADDRCTAAEKEQLNAHLSECPGCSNYYASLCTLNHGISVMKREVPGDMVSYIIHRIQQEDGKGDFAAPGEKPQRPRPQFAFGRFTIIGLCLALVLLAYSHSLTSRESQKNTGSDSPGIAQSENIEPPQPPENPASAGISQPTTPPTAPENSSDPSAGDEPAVPPEEEPNTSSGTAAEESDNSPAENSGSFVPGGGTSSTLIPAGETYAGIYLTTAAAADLLRPAATLSFQASLTDGTTAVYYVVPAEKAEELSTAFSEAGAEASSYTDEPTAIDAAAADLLYIIRTETP